MNSVKAVIFSGLLIASFASAMDMGMDSSKMMMMHEKMAKMHTMATNCMKSGKTMDMCHDKMMKECKMGQEKCSKMMSMMDDSMKKMMDEGMTDEGMMKK